MPTEPRSIGKRLKHWRISQDLKQQELADTLKVSQSYLGRLERDERALSGKFITAIINYFGLDVLSYIMGISDFEATQMHKQHLHKLPKDMEPLFEENPGLQEFFDDKDLLAQLKVTIGELEILAGIKMEADFPMTKAFYMDALLHHRRHLTQLVESARK